MWTDKEGKTWYKGNLHLHTTVFDGVKTPEEAYELYRSRGYDFIARTDHWHASESGEYKGMLLIPGCEYDVGKVTEGGMYHILGLGCGQITEKTNRPRIRIHGAAVSPALPPCNLIQDNAVTRRGQRRSCYSLFYSSIRQIQPSHGQDHCRIVSPVRLAFWPRMEYG